MLPSSQPPRAVIIHFCALEAVTGSACVLVPVPYRAAVTWGRCKGRVALSQQTKHLQHCPSPLLSGKSLSLDFVSCLLCKQGTTHPWYKPFGSASVCLSCCCPVCGLLKYLPLRMAKLCILPLCPVTVFTVGAIIHRHI